MSDFRVQLDYIQNISELLERELDWTNNKWTLSERSSGLGQNWDMGFTLTQEDIYSLLDFFRIPHNSLASETALSLSPGELSLIHAQINSEPTVYADLCHKCSGHWIVYKKDLDTNQWMKYGRDCEFSWFRGDLLDSEDVIRLNNIRR